MFDTSLYICYNNFPFEIKNGGHKMNLTFTFFFNSILLGIGLAMDAFSVSLANGLNEPCMKKRKMCGVAGTFAFFQALMPMIGWVCVHTIVQYFTIRNVCCFDA